GDAGARGVGRAPLPRDLRLRLPRPRPLRPRALDRRPRARGAGRRHRARRAGAIPSMTVSELIERVRTYHPAGSVDTIQKADDFRKMLLAMARDIRVILIKLADRTHNMRTLGHLPPERQVEIAQETLDIYAPLAHRLGIYWIKSDLEDNALRFLHPEVYYQLKRSVAKRKAEREKYIKEVLSALLKKLAEAEVEAEVTGRPKHFYSIYQKMQ